MCVWRPLWYDLGAARNSTVESNITSSGKSVAKLWPFLYIQDGSQQPPSWILSNQKQRHSIRRPRIPWTRTKHGLDRMQFADRRDVWFLGGVSGWAYISTIRACIHALLSRVKHQNQQRPGLRPRHHWESLQRSPRLPPRPFGLVLRPFGPHSSSPQSWTQIDATEQ